MTREQFISHVESIQGAFRRFLVALCCGDSALADDIAQEALVKAYLASADFSNIEKFNAWIFKIGYNAFLNHRRSVRNTVGYDQISDMTSTESSDSAFRYQALYAALDKLNERERTSILLFYMQGYSVKEISDTIGASQDAVKQYLSRGRSHLRGLINSNE